MESGKDQSVTQPESTNNTPPAWAFAPEVAAARCQDFLRERLAATGHDGFVVGLSGGIDSAVAAALAVRATGAASVLGVMMPYRTSTPASVEDARAVAGVLGIATEQIDISPVVDGFLQVAGDLVADGHDGRVRRGNVMARARMIVLYDLSYREHRLVLGTGNRTEALLGYTTHHGDDACGLNPIGRLYKTEIRLLAEFLALPAAVRIKPPSADLWAGQADEDELGFTYAEADRLLHHLVDEGLEPRQLAALGFASELVAAVSQRVRQMAFKRVVPPVAEFADRPDPDLPVSEHGSGFKDGGIH